jgi:Uma2 family endonuclease
MLWRMPNNGMRRELVKGELREMAPAGSGHGAFTMNLSTPLDAHVRAKKLGVVFTAETGFVLRRDPDTVRAPDVGFVAMHRLPRGGLPDRFFPGAPDLAVEVLSPSDTIFEVEEKVADWIAAGTQLVWMINPRQRTVTVRRADGSVTVLRQGQVLEGQQVVPGFRIAVEDLFESPTPT